MAMTDPQQDVEWTPHWRFGDYMRRAREDAKLSRIQMAALLHISKNTVTNYEHGHTTPPPAAVMRWEQVTNLPEGALMSRFRRPFAHADNCQMGFWDAQVIDLRADRPVVIPAVDLTEHFAIAN